MMIFGIAGAVRGDGADLLAPLGGLGEAALVGRRKLCGKLFHVIPTRTERSSATSRAQLGRHPFRGKVVAALLNQTAAFRGGKIRSPPLASRRIADLIKIRKSGKLAPEFLEVFSRKAGSSLPENRAWQPAHKQSGRVGWAGTKAQAEG
jgi:hypothetical protein